MINVRSNESSSIQQIFPLCFCATMAGYPNLEEQALEMAMAGVGRDDEDESSASEGEETEGSEASSDTEEDTDKKSRDGDREHGGDDQADPSSGAGASSSAEPSPSTTPETFMNHTKEAFEKHIQSILEGATTKEDYIQLKNMLKDYTSILFKGYKAADGTVKKLIKEEKKDERTKQREADKERKKQEKKDIPNITMIIKFQGSDKTITLSVPPKGTLKTIRNILTSMHGYKEKHLKKSRFMLGNLDDGIDMSDRPRREMGKGEKNTGWCLEDNSVITIIFGVQGGGKRASSTSATAKNIDDKKKEIYEDLGLMAMRVANSTIPSITESVKVMMNLKQSMDKGEKNVMTSVLNQLSTKDLMEIQTKCSSTGNTHNKVQHIMKVTFGKICSEMVEMKKQSESMDKAFVLMTHLMLMDEFGNDDATIGWSAFTTKLTSILIKKASSDASDAPATGLTS